MPDFAAHGTRTRSTVAGETLNPYALDRVPGGSSGGTATAVNASFAVLGLGTETGGSIQNPAAAQAEQIASLEEAHRGVRRRRCEPAVAAGSLAGFIWPA